MAEHTAYWPFDGAPALAPEVAARTPADPPRALGGKRLRLSVDDPTFGPTAGPLFLSPPDNDTDWRLLNLDSQTLDRAKPAELVQMLVDLSPDISRALWDFLRFCNPGYEVKALRPGSEEVDKRAQAALDVFLATLKGLYGSVDVILNRLFINAFLRGAFLAELVLDKAGRMPLDLAVPDARWVYFRRKADPERGPVWELYQYQGGVPVSLEKPTIRYVPVDPLPGSPYGRPLASPALFTTVFLIGLLHDLRRVVSQQGYPRLDLSIDSERLKNIMPLGVAQDPVELKRWADGIVTDVEAAFRCLSPDDSYIHMDTVVVNRPVGTVSADSLGAIDGLVSLLERQLARGCKSNPLMMGLPTGMSEASANRLHEAFVSGIKSIQHPCEAVLEHLCTLALQAQGLQATVEWRFAENRASEMLKDQQTNKLRLQNAALAYWMGLISADEMAQMGMDKDAADVPEPRIEGAGIQGGGGGGGATNPENIQADPGSSRMTAVTAGDILAANGNGHG